MGGSGHHLVYYYVRRKPAADDPSSSSCRFPASSDSSQPMGNSISIPQDNPRICSPPPQLSPITTTTALSNPHHQLHSNPMLPSPTQFNTTDHHHWEDRFSKLNNFLNNLDQSDQKDYLHLLRSLSSVELSKHAVELEKRSIQLSLLEAKELQRVQVLDVLERYSKHSRVP